MNIFKFYKNYDNYKLDYSSEIINKFILRVYSWMFCGLILTSFVSWYVSKSSNLLYIFCYNPKITLFLIFFQFVTVFILSNFVSKLNENLTISLFMLYSILTGFNLSVIFILYTTLEIFISILTTSITFMLMTVYGYFTKNDLTNVGNLLLMLLLGIIISSLLNLYLKSEFIMWIISYISIIIFTGLIAYDTQKLKNLGNKLIYLNNIELLNKYSILGALILYLDFINLFLIPLRIINKKSRNN